MRRMGSRSEGAVATRPTHTTPPESPPHAHEGLATETAIQLLDLRRRDPNQPAPRVRAKTPLPPSAHLPSDPYPTVRILPQWTLTLSLPSGVLGQVATAEG